jgi:transcription initiation factor IIF auxiliary subunit
MPETSALRIEQSEKYEDEDWWSWSIWVEGPERELDQIEFVEYTLHPTFPKPVRSIKTREDKFKLSTGGWGVFEIFARAVKKDGSEVPLRHELQLHYPDGTAHTD